MSYITVEKLIGFLQHHDPNNIVVVCTGRKSYGFIATGSPLQGLSSESAYKDGKIGLQKLTQFDEANDCTEDDIITDGMSATILMSREM